jgi:hypothetical protein
VQVNYAIAPRFCWGLFSKKTQEAEQGSNGAVRR